MIKNRQCTTFNHTLSTRNWKKLGIRDTLAAMKYSNLEAFKKHLESAAPDHFSSLYLLLSKETFPRKEAMEKLAELSLHEERSPELSVRIFDGEKHSIEQILPELNALSFFSKKRIIFINNCDSLDKAATTQLETYFASPNKTICLVLAATTLNRATSFYKKAEKIGVLLDITELKPWEQEKIVVEWLHQEVRKYKKQFTPAAGQIFIKQLGTDQTLLQNEIQKLVCYVGERSTIDERDIAAICTSVNLENAWQLGEAIFKRDAASALRISKALLNEGTALIALLRQIRSQFQTEYQICSILAHGGTAADVTAQFPYMKGAILERHLSAAQNYGMERFKKGILAIDTTELKAKNSATEDDLLADILIATITS